LRICSANGPEGFSNECRRRTAGPVSLLHAYFPRSGAIYVSESITSTSETVRRVVVVLVRGVCAAGVGLCTVRVNGRISLRAIRGARRMCPLFTPDGIPCSVARLATAQRVAQCGLILVCGIRPWISLALGESIVMRFGIPYYSWCPGLYEENVQH
jgi:hypothetical protein